MELLETCVTLVGKSSWMLVGIVAYLVFWLGLYGKYCRPKLEPRVPKLVQWFDILVQPRFAVPLVIAISFLLSFHEVRMEKEKLELEVSESKISAKTQIEDAIREVEGNLKIEHFSHGLSVRIKQIVTLLDLPSSVLDEGARQQIDMVLTLASKLHNPPLMPSVDGTRQPKPGFLGERWKTFKEESLTLVRILRDKLAELNA
jgi:hypothetical protein